MDSDEHYALRDRMIRQQILGRGLKSKEVIEAFYRVPRHYFTGDALPDQAYGDHPLPIGDGQTISQPYIVALMTDALNLASSERVLEIGTGSGYQAAILAELVKEVYTIERIAKLQEKAREALESLGYNNISYKTGDGTKGWPEKAPFDGIIITAATNKVPEQLLQQLGTGGSLVAPVGSINEQELIVITRQSSGIEEKNLGRCRFVPLI